MPIVLAGTGTSKRLTFSQPSDTRPAAIPSNQLSRHSANFNEDTILLYRTLITFETSAHFLYALHLTPHKCNVLANHEAIEYTSRPLYDLQIS